MKKNIFTLLVFVSLTLSGCRDWLDINENPNYVSKADKTTLLPTVALMTADKVGYELTLTGYFWAQYTVQNRNTSQYTTVMNYDLNTQSAYFTSPWCISTSAYCLPSGRSSNSARASRAFPISCSKPRRCWPTISIC